MTGHEDLLARYQFQMGPLRGRLATALDILTDALALAGQHGMYCHNPGSTGQAAPDLRAIIGQIEDSKALIIETMQELKGGSR
jgi:hypothetical protein